MLDACFDSMQKVWCYTEKATQAQQHPGIKTATNPAEDNRNRFGVECCKQYIDSSSLAQVRHLDVSHYSLGSVMTVRVNSLRDGLCNSGATLQQSCCAT